MRYRQKVWANRCTTDILTLRNYGRPARHPTSRTRCWTTGVRVTSWRQRVATTTGSYPDVPTITDGECRSCGVSVLDGQTKCRFCLTNHLGDDATSTKFARPVSKRTQMKAKSKNVPTICRTTSRRRPRSRSRRLTTTATTTGSGERGTRSRPDIKGQSIRTNEGVNTSDYRFLTPRVLFDFGALGKVVTAHPSSRVKTVGTRKNLRLD